MNNSFSIMRKIDEHVLELYEQLKLMPGYQKMIDEFNLLEEWMQQVVKAAIMVLIFLIPLTIIMILHFQLGSVKDELARFEDIVANSNSIIDQNRQLRENTAQFYGTEIVNQEMLSSRINIILSGTGVESQNMNISNFDLIEDSGVNIISASLQFRNLSDSNFFSFLKRFVFVENFKITSIEIEKNKESSLLYGKLGISYYSKIISEFDEE